MWAVKLCSYRILQLLTGVLAKTVVSCIMVVKRLSVSDWRIWCLFILCYTNVQFIATSSPVGWWSIVISIACMSVCSHISKSSRPIFTIFSLHVACGQGLVLWWQCSTLYTSGFVDDVTFSRNGANGLESKTTRMFRPARQVAPPGQSCCLLVPACC